ncbi:biotin--[acetyl-CoA-carboxylase] ligase [Actinomyces sp. B33]|uniref:biotin--[acetyl-CoA-carboxylase] ligase n=1 Tax=Actinomyces sp. B33 TaxID=2942131 RepID=UPI002341A650|nr:biotin--[acetyl-CoA-carboxylase] ligase [Actinomyces sp. B33]MDC4232392.1 biotin--[acetyl-CoA-carboxylase] ligase [Actinomyces sp. B33]
MSRPETSAPILRYGTVDSALTVLARIARDAPGPAPLTTVVARHQTGGRGRSGRAWADDPGSLLLAVLVDVPDADLSWTTPVAGLAVAAAIADLGHRPRLKWPNDVLVDGRKVAGILCEHIDSPTALRPLHRVGVGIGLNLGTVPSGAGPLAGALDLAGADRDETAESLILAIRDGLARLLAADRPAWKRDYERLLARPDAPCSVRLPDGARLDVRPTGVDDDGALLALDADSRPIRIAVGDVDLPSSTGPRPPSGVHA